MPASSSTTITVAVSSFMKDLPLCVADATRNLRRGAPVVAE
jgi:hypothetical protein